MSTQLVTRAGTQLYFLNEMPEETHAERSSVRIILDQERYTEITELQMNKP